jgi:hypothetical protein
VASDMLSTERHAIERTGTDRNARSACEGNINMTTVTIQLTEVHYQRLEHAAKRTGKSVQALIHDWIVQLPESEEPFDVTQDPVFQMEGYESEAPADLSVNLDHYRYGESARQ